MLSESEGSPERFAELLRVVDKLDFIAVFRGFIEAKVELADRLESSGLARDASEDTLDDLSDSLVTAGRDVYIATFELRRSLPERDRWHELPTLTGEFGSVYEERFGGDIYDEIEDLC